MKRKYGEAKPIYWNIPIPQKLATEVELSLLNPVSGKPEYGARARLITALLRGWVQDNDQQQVTILKDNDND